jgi:hypothetical protein
LGKGILIFFTDSGLGTLGTIVDNSVKELGINLLVVFDIPQNVYILEGFTHREAPNM